MRLPFVLGQLNPADFERQGYLRVRVTPEVLRLIEDIIATAKPFFRLPQPTKQLASLPGVHEGWQPFGGEFSITPDRPDLHESFWVTRGRAHLAGSRYPSGMARELHDKMMAYLDVIQQIEAGLMADLARWLGSDPDVAALRARSLDSDLQVLYYQPARETRDLLQDPHEDSLSLTFTWADQPGLELLGPDGRFVPAELAPDELAVMPGEVLALITGFRVSPQIHRVVRFPDQTERMTLSYFSAPDVGPDAEIRPWVRCPQNERISVAEQIASNRSKYLVR